MELSVVFPGQSQVGFVVEVAVGHVLASHAF